MAEIVGEKIGQILDSIKVIYRHNVFKSQQKIDPFWLTDGADDLVYSVLDFVIQQRENIDEKQSYSHVAHLSERDVEENWGKHNGGHKNSDLMCDIRRVMRYFEECGVVRIVSRNDENSWITHTWSFTPNVWRDRFKLSRENLLNVIQTSKQKFENDLLFVCQDRCCQRIYSLAVIEDIHNKCEKCGKPLEPIDTAKYMQEFEDDMLLLRTLQFPAIESIAAPIPVQADVKPHIKRKVHPVRIVDAPLKPMATDAVASDPMNSSLLPPMLWWRRRTSPFFVPFSSSESEPNMQKHETKPKTMTALPLTEDLQRLYDLLISQWKTIVELSLKQKDMVLATVANSIRPCKSHIYQVIGASAKMDKKEFDKQVQKLCDKTEEATPITRIINDNSHLRLGWQGVEDFIKYHQQFDPSIDAEEIRARVRLTSDGKMLPKPNLEEDPAEKAKSPDVPEKKTRIRVRSVGKEQPLVPLIQKSTVKTPEAVPIAPTETTKSTKRIAKSITEKSAEKKSAETAEAVSIPDHVLRILKKPFNEVSLNEFHDLCQMVNVSLGKRTVKVVTSVDVIEEGEKIRPDFAKIFMRYFFQETQVPLWFNLRADSYIIESTLGSPKQ